LDLGLDLAFSVVHQIVDSCKRKEKKSTKKVKTLNKLETTQMKIEATH
jgi:hypothetical protein